MISLSPKILPFLKEVAKKIFNITMIFISIVINILVPLYILYYAYAAYEQDKPQVMWIFVTIAGLMFFLSYYERRFWKGYREFHKTKDWLEQRQALYQMCNSENVNSINKTLEAIKAEVRGLKEREEKNKNDTQVHKTKEV